MLFIVPETKDHHQLPFSAYQYIMFSLKHGASFLVLTVPPTRSEPKRCRGAEPEPLTSSRSSTARQPQEMCRGRRCWGLGSLVLLLLGQNLALHIEIPQDAVSGTVGQSVLLPVSYRLDSSLPFPLAIEWKFGKSSKKIIICLVLDCSVDFRGAPRECSARSYTHFPYRGRVEVFPENASLLLRDLRLNDSGVYSIVFEEQSQSRQITLAIYDQHDFSGHPDEDTAVRIPCYSLGACYCFILLLMQLLFHLLLCLRGGHQQRSRPGEA